jgi:hypothetical protein
MAMVEQVMANLVMTDQGIDDSVVLNSYGGFGNER